MLKLSVTIQFIIIHKIFNNNNNIVCVGYFIQEITLLPVEKIHLH